MQSIWGYRTQFYLSAENECHPQKDRIDRSINENRSAVITINYIPDDIDTDFINYYQKEMGYSFVKSNAARLNFHIKEVLAREYGDLNITFITYSHYVETED